MADITYEVATQFTGEGELREAATAFDRMGDSAKRSLSDIERDSKRGGLGLLNLEAGLNLAGQAFGTFKNLAAGALGALTEGAALADARGDFEDLTAAIGTTAAAMQGELKAATGGLITDAQLIADASNLMALNLGLSKDQIVAFAGVAAELDWNMEALADTLNTGSTRGLKEMELSIDDVKGKMAALEAQGIATDEAFRLAILDAAEEKIGRVGKKSEEAAGQIQKLGVIIENAGDKFKEAFATGVAEAMGAAIDQTELLDQAIQDVGQSAGDLAGNLGGTAAFQFATDAALKRYKDAGGDMAEINRQIKIMEQARGMNFLELGFDPRDAEIAAERYRIVAEALAEIEREEKRIGGIREFIPSGELPKATIELRDYTAVLAQFTQASNQEIKNPIADLASGNWSYVPEIMGQVNEALLAQSELAINARDAWAEYTAVITDRGGDIFADFVQEANDASQAGQQWALDINQAIFDAMAAGGAGAGPLADFADELGIAAEDINAALTAMQQQAIIENLAGQADAGKIAWQDFAAVVQDAFRILEGGPAVDLGARIAPEVDMRGFRENFQEQLSTEGLDQNVTIMVDADTTAAVTAVNEAKGLVEGFVNPDQVYKAIMDMDISAVETGVSTATQLIEGIPTNKVVTIEWQESGASVTAALRALGVIP